MRTLAVAILIALTTAYLPSKAYSDNQSPLKVVTLPLPPWGFQNEVGQSNGICYEWANAIAERMGRKVDNRIVPMARLFKSIEYGQADFSIMLRTPYSEKFSIPIANVGVPFRTIVWPRKGIEINNYNDLKKVRISMARGLKVGGQFAKQKNLRIMPSMDYAHSMQMFRAGRVDAIIGTQQSLSYNAIKTGLVPTQEFDTPFVLANLEGWVQASQEFAAREGLDELKAATKSLIADGTFERIYRKYQSTMVSHAY